jgi:hypothetical protein
MSRLVLPTAALFVTFIAALSGANAATDPIEPDTTLTEIQVVAQRLNEARAGIQTQTGASTYTIDAAALAATPGGDNTLLNQVIMQAPDVAQDSFGQFHVRGEHNGLQYRINGLILPEGIAAFGQSLDPRLIQSMSLITGALPAEYGLRTAGIIDISTKSGLLEQGGGLSLYGGSHSTVQPSFNYGGGAGRLSYFVSGDLLHSGLGIESPDGRANPIHDRTAQTHVFGYVENILDDKNRLAFMGGSSVGTFQIPNLDNAQPDLGLIVNGQSSYLSQNLNETQREVTHFGVASWQHASGPLNVQTSLVARYSSLTFTPDPLGDLLFTGIAQHAFKENVAYAVQSDGSWQLNDSHTVRGGIFIQTDHSISTTASQVLVTNNIGVPLTDVPVLLTDSATKTEYIYSAYLQDEWTIMTALTVNYGLRLDRFTAFASGGQASPRLNAVWKLADDTTVHAGYARYLSPPPFELIGGKQLALFQNTTSAPLSGQDDLPQAERANYYDVGVQQKFFGQLTLAIDTYAKQSINLTDEGQFGAPIILTPFSYRYAKQYGVEVTANYTAHNFSAYLNLAAQSAKGKRINSSQFNFSETQLAWIANNYTHLDHEQQHTASGGMSYLWQGTRLSFDFVYGSGLRRDLPLAAGQSTPYGGSDIPNGSNLSGYMASNLGLSHVFHIGDAGALTARVDAINLFDSVYQVRDGTGIGVGAPQFGARRGIFFGLSMAL